MSGRWKEEEVTLTFFFTRGDGKYKGCTTKRDWGSRLSRKERLLIQKKKTNYGNEGKKKKKRGHFLRLGKRRAEEGPVPPTGEGKRDGEPQPA